MANVLVVASMIVAVATKGRLTSLIGIVERVSGPQVLLSASIVLAAALVLDAMTTRVVRLLTGAAIPTHFGTGRLYSWWLELQRRRYFGLRLAIEGQLSSIQQDEQRGQEPHKQHHFNQAVVERDEPRQRHETDRRALELRSVNHDQDDDIETPPKALHNEDDERLIASTKILLERYPAPDRLLATALANALRVAEDKVGDRYSLSYSVVFPRLYVILPRKRQRALDNSAARIDFSARLAFTLGLASLLALGLASRYSVVGLASPYSVLGFLAFLVLWLLARWAYGSSIEYAVAHGEQLEVAFDLYRMDLLRRLNIKVPGNKKEEQDIFATVSRDLAGVAAHNLPFVYSSNRVRAVNVMGDQFNVEQAMAVGPDAKAKAKNVYFTQLRDDSGREIDLTQLAQELSKLRAALKDEPDTPERDSALGAIADAEVASKQGDSAKVVENLARAGKWVIGIAEKIGVGLAVAAIKSAIGV
jgi:hypothetical protein